MPLPFPLHLLEDIKSFPHAGTSDTIELKQTHISVVVLLNEVVYKLRKSVRTPFLDFTTLQLREHDCWRELELNRRLAPDVYLGVVPVLKTQNGIIVDPTVQNGEVVEWAVKMKRLPADATLADHLQRDTVGPAVLERLAQYLHQFYEQASSTPAMAKFGTSSRVLKNALDNFDDIVDCPLEGVNPALIQRLRKLFETKGTALAPLIDRRARSGKTCDTHGDLHLEHIYWFPDRPVDQEFVIIDCVEFNEAFRYADPVADIAFTYMDLGFRGRSDLADCFSAAYFRASGDEEGRQLLPFYSAYRASVRAKVEQMQICDKELSQSEIESARQRAIAHWLYSLGELSGPRERPGLILFGGLPGSGKSSLAKALCEESNQKILLIRSDVVRREIHLRHADEDRYSPTMTERTYDTCLSKARDGLLTGRRVVIDANFPEDRWRQRFLELARTLAVPGVFIHCQVDSQIAKDRIDQRRGDVSEADIQVYDLISRRWECPSRETERSTVSLNTAVPIEDALTELMNSLRNYGLSQCEQDLPGPNDE